MTTKELKLEARTALAAPRKLVSVEGAAAQHIKESSGTLSGLLRSQADTYCMIALELPDILPFIKMLRAGTAPHVGRRHRRAAWKVCSPRHRMPFTSINEGLRLGFRVQNVSDDVASITSGRTRKVESKAPLYNILKNLSHILKNLPPLPALHHPRTSLRHAQVPHTARVYRVRWRRVVAAQVEIESKR
jgi:hypothetical protein